MNVFRWQRLFVRALGPALVCAGVAGWGVYLMTDNERPTYRSEALLSTGIMSGVDKADYVRDLVINEIEGIQNLASSFEIREELATRLLATYLSLRAPDPAIISARAYRDLQVELDPSLVARHAYAGNETQIYESLVAERDSLRRYGEANAKHPLIALLYGDNALVGIKHLGAELRVERKGLSDMLKISYATVDAAWCRRTLDTHLATFLGAHEGVKLERTDGALAYFRRATAEARSQLEEAEQRLRTYSADHRIINYYEQTRAIATERKDIDQQYTEELMRAAGAVEAIKSLELRLADRVNLVKLNHVIDERRRELSELGRREARLRVMTPDSSRGNATAISKVSAEQAKLRRELSDDVVRLQGVYQGPEGVELGRLLNEWIAAVLQRESSRGKVQVLDQAKRDFDATYEEIAYQGSSLKKIEREVHIAEEDYLENLRNLNDALQKEHTQASTSSLRLVDVPTLPTLPEKSRRLHLLAAGVLMGGLFPFVLGIALELLTGALTSFEEAERCSGLGVAGGVARWSTARRVLRKRYKRSLDIMTADLLWQGIRSKTESAGARSGPQLVAVTALQPGSGKTQVVNLLAQRLAERGFQVAVIGDVPSWLPPDDRVQFRVANVLGAAVDTEPWELCGFRHNEWAALQIVLWEMPAVATGRLPIDLVRRADNVLLVHPPSQGWSKNHASSAALLSEAAGRKPLLVLNGLSADILLHLWGASWRELGKWTQAIQSGAVERGVRPLPSGATPISVPTGLPFAGHQMAPAPSAATVTIPSLQTLQTAPASVPTDDWATQLSHLSSRKAHAHIPPTAPTQTQRAKRASILPPPPALQVLRPLDNDSWEGQLLAE